MGVRCEGVKVAIADFLCFNCPLVASAEATPLPCGADLAVKKNPV